MLVLIGLGVTVACALAAFLFWEMSRARDLRRQVEEAAERYAGVTGHVDVLEKSAEPFVMFDARGLIRTLNGRAEKLFGFETKELYGQSILRIIPNLPGARESTRGRIEVQRRDGERVSLDFRATRTEGERQIYLFFSEPVRNVLAGESPLAIAERVVGRILSHLEEPLTTINGYSGLALACAENAPVRDELEQIVAAGERASRIAVVLLGFTGKQAASVALVDLNAEVRAMEADIRASVKAEVLFSTDRNPARVWVNAEALRETMLILCVSAQLRCPADGGKIDVSVETHPTHHSLKVQDNGKSLSDEAKVHMFEPLYLNRDEIGVELSPIYGLVHKWKGEIRVANAGNSGTVFDLMLPPKR